MGHQITAYYFPENFGVAADAEPIPAVTPATVVQSPSDAEIFAANAAAYERGRMDERIDYDKQLLGVLSNISSALDRSTSSASQLIEASAMAFGRMIVDAVCAGFPAMRERFGEQEVAKFIETTVKGLIRCNNVRVIVNPRHSSSVIEQLARLSNWNECNVQVDAAEAVQIGDVEIHWHEGRAIRESAPTLAAVESILRAFGIEPDEARSVPNVE